MMPTKSSPLFGNDPLTASRLAQYIDHTKLTYEPGEDHDEAIIDLCLEAKQYRCYAVCIRPDKLTFAKNLLQGSTVKLATVIGFPDKKYPLDAQANRIIGNVPLAQKLDEARKAIADGAEELDLVMNVHHFKTEAPQNPSQTLAEFKAIKQIAGKNLLKVIIETDLLTPQQIRQATQTCIHAGVDMVKTSTGMLDGGKGALPEHIALIHQTLVDAGKENTMGIKASGGIKTASQAQTLIEHGATRLGIGQKNAITILKSLP